MIATMVQGLCMLPFLKVGLRIHEHVVCSLRAQRRADMLKVVISTETKLFLQEELDCFMAWHKLPCTSSRVSTRSAGFMRSLQTVQSICSVDCVCAREAHGTNSPTSSMSLS